MDETLYDSDLGLKILQCFVELLIEDNSLCFCGETIK